MTRRKRKPASLAIVSLASVTVENPLWSRDHHGDATNPRFTTATVNVRESAVEWLYARKVLGFSQKRAADHFRQIWEQAGGTVPSIDFASIRVDGRIGDPVTSRLRALRELSRARILLGVRGYRLVVAVAGEGNGLADLSRDPRGRKTLADNLRADLDLLASMWGMQTRTTARYGASLDAR